MKQVYVGNLESYAGQMELEQLFNKYGKVDRVDMKRGYAFVHFEDEREAEYAIKKLNDTPFGDEKRKLVVEWAKDAAQATKKTSKPTKTLFVVNFDPIKTREGDIRRHFEPYGKIRSVKIRCNYAFVKFATQEDATKAFQATQTSKIFDKVVSIDYALTENERYNRYTASLNNERSPTPPIIRRRSSPDYSRYRGPEHDRYRTRSMSPDYSRRPRTRSPAGYGRYRTKSRSPDYSRRARTRSPAGYGRYKNRSRSPRGRP